MAPKWGGNLSEVIILFLFIYKFIYFIYFYFWLRWVFVAVRGLSLVAARGGLLFVAVRRLLTAVASLVVEHRL